jgi:hypothetical protein
MNQSPMRNESKGDEVYAALIVRYDFQLFNWSS